jgi:hypothetical protein
MGEATDAEAETLSLAWLGPDVKLTRSGKAWVSADGLQTYRPPQFKEKRGIVQANVAVKDPIVLKIRANGHLKIVDDDEG